MIVANGHNILKKSIFKIFKQVYFCRAMKGMEWDRKIDSRDESVHIQFQAYVTLCKQRANLLGGAIFPFAPQVREN